MFSCSFNFPEKKTTFSRCSSFRRICILLLVTIILGVSFCIDMRDDEITKKIMFSCSFVKPRFPGVQVFGVQTIIRGVPFYIDMEGHKVYPKSCFCGVSYFSENHVFTYFPIFAPVISFRYAVVTITNFRRGSYQFSWPSSFLVDNLFSMYVYFYFCDNHVFVVLQFLSES